MNSNIDWNQLRKKRLKRFIPFTEEFELGVLALVLFCFGVGYLAIAQGFKDLGKTFIAKRRRDINWGEPFEWEIWHSIPIWFAGILFIAIGMWGIYQNLKIDKEWELHLEEIQKKSTEDF